jgi:hypothetical protein
MLSRTLGALAAASLLAGSAAAARPAAPLSLAGSPAALRAGADLEDSGALDRRGVGIYIIGAVALGLIIWGIIELTSDDEEDFPTSP